jgi:hypothetical protein
MKKAELITRIESARASLEAAIGRLSKEQLEIESDNGWSAKAHLAHLAAWEMGIAALLQKQARYEAMGIDEDTFLHAGEEAINETIYEQSRDKSVSEIMLAFHESHRQLLAALDALENEDLKRPYDYYQPDQPYQPDEGGAVDDRPIINWIIGNTYEHYDLHRPFLEQLANT